MKNDEHKENFFFELKKRWDLVLISLVFIIFAIYNYSWVINDTSPPTWDDSWHLTSTLRYYQIITNPDFDMFDKLVHVDWFYPPFYKFSTALFYLIFGTSIDSSIMINTLYLGIMMFSTYGIGKILFNRETGLIASILVSMYPIIISSQHIFLLDLGLASMVTLTVYLLLKTENFKSFWYSLALGLVIGMALLTKWTSAFFIMGPFLFLTYKTFRTDPIKIDNKKKNKKGKKKKEIETEKSSETKFRNLLIACIAGIFVASIWYIPNGEGAYNWVKEMAPYWASVEEEPTDVLSFYVLSYYTILLIPQISFLFAAIFIIGSIHLIKQRNEKSIILFSWIIIPIILLTLYLNKNGRYSIPILSSVAIVSSYWLSVMDKKIKLAIISIIILLGGIQVASMASGNSSIHNSLTLFTLPELGDISLFPPGDSLPRKEDWKHEEVLNDILRDAYTNEIVKSRGYGYIVILPDHAFINGRTFEYYSFKNGLPFEIYNGAYLGEQSFYTNFKNFDYIIIKSGNNTGPYKKLVDSEYQFFEKNKESYILMKDTDLPDGTDLSIYRNKY